MATTNKNFKVKNGLEVAGEIGVGATPSYGTTGQILSSQGAGNAAAWIDVAPAASYTSVVKHDVRLAEAITKGQAVYVSSSNGSNIVVSKASNASEATSSKTLGLLESSGSTNNQRNVVTEGLLGGIDVGAAVAGDPVWLGTSGNLIYGLTNKPIAPAHLVFIGIVTRDGNNGEIFVRVQNGFELNEIHNVLIGTDYTANSIPADNEFLAYNLGTNLWINQTAEEAGVANLSGATFTGNVAGTNANLSGNVNATTFNGSGSGLTSIPNSATTANSANGASTIVARDVTGSFTANDIYATTFNGNVNATTVNATTLIGNTNASTITTGTIDNARTTAASANGASTIVARDASGNFAANAITTTSLASKSISLTSFVGNPVATFTNEFGSQVGGISASGNITGALFIGSGANLTSIPAANITGTVADGTTTTAASGVGYMGIPQNIESASYSVVAGDAGKHIYATTSGTTITIPANSNVAFPIGTTIVVVAGHSTGNTTIALTSDTLRLSVVGTTGSRTLAAYGMATLVKVAATTWFISGNGLT